MKDVVCIELDRNDIAVLVQKKPLAGLDMLTMLGRQFHASQRLIQLRASRNPNVLIEEESSFGERIADSVARFGGSWNFIISFAVVLTVYTIVQRGLGRKSLGPVPLHPAQLISLHAGRGAGAGDHDEPEPAGHQGSAPQ